VYTASDFDYILVKCCDTCKTYIKSVDLTENGLAEPTIYTFRNATMGSTLAARRAGM
jgi:formate dehydrogenase maturation protein FdhE